MAGYEEENQSAELVTAGGTGGRATHELCGTAAAMVPATPAEVRNVKYQPKVAEGSDYNTGATNGPNRTAAGGWKCLKFEMNQPQYYRYGYAVGALPPTYEKNPTTTEPAVGAAGWYSAAEGDLDDDGRKSNFITGGQVEATSKKAITFTQVLVVEPEE